MKENRWSVASLIFFIGLLWPIGELIRVIAGAVLEDVIAVFVPDNGGGAR